MASYFIPASAMKSITETTQGNPYSLFKRAKQELSRFRKMTLRKLSQCKQSGRCIFISASALGEGTFRSFVQDIYKNGLDEVIILKWYDRNNFASLTHVFIEEIHSVNDDSGIRSNRPSSF